MKIQQFLGHHGIAANPFADEDAQTDLVFKGSCIKSTYHPTWDKIYGDPSEPATSIVFGEKGAGKTAIGLQIVRHLAEYNANHPQQQVFVIQYDDFNPFLDRFRDRFSGRRRRVERALAEWKLWDHMDAILALGVTQLVDRALGTQQSRIPAVNEAVPLPLAKLDRAQARDLLLLAACYDQSPAGNPVGRWSQLRRKLRFPTWRSRWDVALGVAGTVATAAVIAACGAWSSLATPWPYLALAAGWLPLVARRLRWAWRAHAIRRHTKVLNHQGSRLRQLLQRFPAKQIDGQPLPLHRRTDDRYGLLEKFQNLLRTLGFGGVVVLVDRLDEPHLVNGSAELMRALLWPMLDNKFLKHTGIGLKLLLPAELTRFIDRESRDFYERARLDKQNLVRSLAWTGAALYDVADARVKACAAENGAPSIGQLFDPAIDRRRLQDAFATLRVPRHLFKFMYRLITTHCNAHTEEEPAWTITPATFESVLALYQRDLDAVDRGVGAG